MYASGGEMIFSISYVVEFQYCVVLVCPKEICFMLAVLAVRFGIHYGIRPVMAGNYHTLNSQYNYE